MNKLNVNNNFWKRVTATVVAGTFVFSLAGCSTYNGKYIQDAGEYTNGAVLDDDSEFKNAFVIEVDGVKRIVNDDQQSIYSKYQYNTNSWKMIDLYKYLDERIVDIPAGVYELKDWLNLEKYINGGSTYDLLPVASNAEESIITKDDCYYKTPALAVFHDGSASLSYVSILFVDGKADRIVRIFKTRGTENDKQATDIISARKIDPQWNGLRKFTTLVTEAYDGHDIEFVPILDMLDFVDNTTLTEKDIVKLYYAIADKDKSEVIETVNNQLVKKRDN